MKKFMLMAVAATMISAPAFAADKMGQDAKAQKMTDYWFSKADTNNDGMVSKEEATAAGDKMFTMADKNNDGMISKDESIAAKKMEMHEMMGMKSGSSSHSAMTKSTTSTSTTDTGSDSDSDK